MSAAALSACFQTITHAVLHHQLCIGTAPVVLVFDRQSPLASLLADAYIANLPHARHLDFDTVNPAELRAELLALPAGATVILVQSRDFRLDQFRIRLLLFQRGVGCLEHTHLHYFAAAEYETYAAALTDRSEYYHALGSWLLAKLATAQKLEIISVGGARLTFGALEPPRLNDGRFFAQKNRGGGALVGEVFTEARDFASVHGTLAVTCFPDAELRIVRCQPFILNINQSRVTCTDPACPPEFRTRILDRIAAAEGEVWLREAGFGLNPAISFDRPLSDVNAFERMCGFHASLGKKHTIYRAKLPAGEVQRFHIDVFPLLEAIEIDGENVWENGRYLYAA